MKMVCDESTITCDIGVVVDEEKAAESKGTELSFAFSSGKKCKS